MQEPKDINEKAKSLCDEGLCRSMGEARRLISNSSPEKLEKHLEKVRANKNIKGNVQ